MSHFAEIDENKIVVRVLVADNDAPNEGYDWFVENLGGRWVQTSYNGNFRKRYARVGFKYDEELDAFIPPQPYPSWALDENTCLWQPPVEYPQDDNRYAWHEQSMTWKLIPTEDLAAAE